MEKSQIEDCVLGVYDTKKLISLLGVLGKDINLTVIKSGDKSIALKVSDVDSSINFMLTDTAVINDPPQLKEIPEFELNIDVNKTFMDKFKAGVGSLTPEVENFTIITNGDDVKLVIGHSSNQHTNRVTIPVNTTKVSDIDNVTFQATNFKEILSANSECESATLEVSSEGLSRITFKIDDYISTYYMVSVQDVD